MEALLWITVGVPLASALLVRVAVRGDRALAVTGAAAGAAAAGILLVAAAGDERTASGFGWLGAGDALSVGLRLDPLSAAMSATVAGVGLVVVVYSTGYFATEPRRRSALAGLLAFLAAMQGLVLADGFLALLFFWELVGAASARLIAFNRGDPRAAPGAVRAFLVTRSADVGLYLAVFALFAATGSLGFTSERPDGYLGALVGLGLVIAAVGKSAQAPLQTWLMGAMAGPTPVSALLHSATMVAAGVYLLMRGHELLAGWPLDLAAWIGGLTAVAGAVIALAQDDLKRVLAGSTSSQLGLMFVGVAVGGPVVALFHLIAHAAGKACMFLAAGVFQHERGSTALLDLRGAGRDDRAAFGCFALGALSVAAAPPLAGFWSKEHIAAGAEHEAAWFALVLLAAAGAAAYLLRPALVLWDRAGATAGRAPAGRNAMLLGAGALAVAATAGGILGQPLKRLVGGELPSSTLSLVLSLTALAAGAVAVLVGARAPSALAGAARRHLYADELLAAAFQRPALMLAAGADAADRRLVDRAVDGTARGGLRAAALSDVVERRGVDRAVDGIAQLVGAAGRRARTVQTGRLYQYLRATALGGAGIAALFVLTALL